MRFEKAVNYLLSTAGIKINGSRPWDIQLNPRHADEFYDRIALTGSLGLGESYMDGWWECQAIDQLIERIVRTDLRAKALENWNWPYLFQLGINWVVARVSKFGQQSKVFEVADQHYNLGNDFYKAMLDPRMGL